MHDAGGKNSDSVSKAAKLEAASFICNPSRHNVRKRFIVCLFTNVGQDAKVSMTGI